MWPLWAVIASPIGRSVEDRSADLAVVGRMSRGDETALGQLYDRHARPVYSLALRILQDTAEAEDVVQEVFTQAWRDVSRYDPRRGAPAAWLLTMARSRSIDRLRARRVRPEGKTQPTLDREIHDIPDQRSLPDEQLLSTELIVRVRRALAELPLLQRAALELAYYEGLTHAEIAERLEQPLGTVKTRIRLAMIKLREVLAGA